MWPQAGWCTIFGQKNRYVPVMQVARVSISNFLAINRIRVPYVAPYRQTRFTAASPGWSLFWSGASCGVDLQHL